MQSDEVIEKTSPNECRSFGPSKKFVTWQGGGRTVDGGESGGRRWTKTEEEGKP